MVLLSGVAGGGSWSTSESRFKLYTLIGLPRDAGSASRTQISEGAGVGGGASAMDGWDPGCLGLDGQGGAVFWDFDGWDVDFDGWGTDC